MGHTQEKRKLGVHIYSHLYKLLKFALLATNSKSPWLGSLLTISFLLARSAGVSSLCNAHYPTPSRAGGTQLGEAHRGNKPIPFIFFSSRFLSTAEMRLIDWPQLTFSSDTLLPKATLTTQQLDVSVFIEACSSSHPYNTNINRDSKIHI